MFYTIHCRFIDGCEGDLKEARRRWDITRHWRESEVSVLGIGGVGGVRIMMTYMRVYVCNGCFCMHVHLYNIIFCMHTSYTPYCTCVLHISAISASTIHIYIRHYTHTNIIHITSTFYNIYIHTYTYIYIYRAWTRF